MDQVGRHDAGRAPSDGHSGGSIESYARRREERRRNLTLRSAVVALAMAAGLFLRLSTQTAGIVIACIVAVTFVIPRLVLGLRDQRERSQRRTGQDPSWPARLPALVARSRGLSVRPKLPDHTELLGHLTRGGDGWRWIPTHQQAKMGIDPVLFGHPRHAEVRRIWGPWNQGCVTFQFDDAPPAVLWVRQPQDLMRYLAAH